MQTDQWDILSRIFHRALELPPEERDGFVASECGNDTGLRMQVQRLLRAEEEAGSWLVQPAALSPADAADFIADGDLLCDRFAIRRTIATGGMGTVYEAWDAELKTAVAVKVIRPEIVHDAEVVDRFRREVALARRITSPNVCRTFDLERTVHRGREVVFLTMEFLPGVTLAERLRACGALTPAEALRVGRDIAGALAAAHALGVVHRDIKPGNIMLVESVGAEERVVVTDFGLARPVVAADDGLTRVGMPIGTLSYMAPEQLDGSAVTPAADIYALALVMVEMLSGKRLFASGNPLSGLVERVTRPAQLHGVLPAGTPTGWRDVLERALSPQAAERPATAPQLIHELEAASAPAGLLRLARRSARPQRNTHTPARRWLRPATIAFAVVFAVALSALTYRLIEVKGNASLQQGATVYIAPLDNSTGARELDHAGVLLATGVSQSPHIRLLDADRVAATLRTMKRPEGAVIDHATAREIARRAGAVRVLFPSLLREGKGYAVEIAIEQPDNDPSRYRARWTRRFAWNADGSGKVWNGDTSRAMRDAGDWIRQKTGESSEDIARLNVPPEDATTDNWQALDEYARADSLLLAGKTDDGITALQRATQLDPQFSLAHARLGDVLYSRDRWMEGLAAYRQAMASTGRQRLTRRELDRVRGIYANDTHDYATAEAQFRDMASFYPNDWLAWFYQGTPLMRLGRMPEAMEVLRKAHNLAPQRASATATLAEFSLQVGDAAGAAAWTQKIRDAGFLSLAAWHDGEAALLRGDFAAAQSAFNAVKASQQSPPGPLGGYQSLAHLAAEQGLYADAIALVNEALPKAEAQGETGKRTSMLMDRAWLHCEQRQFNDCEADMAVSLHLDHTSHRLRVAAVLVLHFAPSAPASDAQRLSTVLRENSTDIAAKEIGPVFDMARLETEAAQHLALHHCDPALQALRGAAAVDAAVESRQYLAEGLEQCALWEPSVEKARALRQEAADAYAAVAFSPAVSWNLYRLYPPAPYAQNLGGWLRTTSERGPRYNAALQRLHQLRPGQNSSDVATTTPHTIH